MKAIELSREKLSRFDKDKIALLDGLREKMAEFDRLKGEILRDLGERMEEVYGKFYSTCLKLCSDG